MGIETEIKAPSKRLGVLVVHQCFGRLAPEEPEHRGREGGVEPVSYTHLDVYKRQILKVSHYINLMRFEGESFDQKMILRGSLELSLIHI